MFNILAPHGTIRFTVCYKDERAIERNKPEDPEDYSTVGTGPMVYFGKALLEFKEEDHLEIIEEIKQKVTEFIEDY